MEFDPPLDAGIKRYVEVLSAAGVETFESCEGGNGHSYAEPTIRFHGGRSEGFKALAVAQQHRLPVAALRRTWPIDDGEPTGPWWEITFHKFGDADLNDDYVARIDAIISTVTPSRGSVAGRLQIINVHNQKTEFYLYPVVGPRIICSFPESMLKKVCDALKQKRSVTVFGTLYFPPDRPLPDRVKVEKLDVHPLNDKLPRLADLKGMSPHCTGNLDSVEFVRALRDGW